MTPALTVLTVTCDQPIGFALCEHYLARQTWPLEQVQWIVVDDGVEPITPTRGQEYHRRQREPGGTGVDSFCRNLLEGLSHVQGTHLAFFEHDDWYAPTHLEQLVQQLHDGPSLAAGDDDQRYYNVATRQWRTWKNVGACLCQTMMRRAAVARLEEVIHGCLTRQSYGVDTTFWRGVPTSRRAIAKTHTVVGIKGLPGRAGLGFGHRPDEKWTADPSLEQLRRWIGRDADRYADLGAHATP